MEAKKKSNERFDETQNIPNKYANISIYKTSIAKKMPVHFLTFLNG